jgi:putative DNA primase/helicase
MLFELRSEGATAKDVESLERAVRATLRERQRGLRAVKPNEAPRLVRVRTAIPDAPVPDAAVVPAGYRLSLETGVEVERRTKDSEEVDAVAPVPVVVVGRSVDIVVGQETLTLAWFRDGRWLRRTVNRGIVADARQLVGLADFGFPVTSSSASKVADFIAAFESVNARSLPRAHVSSHMGWLDGGKRGFLCGRLYIRADGSEANEFDLETIAPEDWRDDSVTFRGADDGDEQVADAFEAAGSFEQWARAFELARPYPRPP